MSLFENFMILLMCDECRVLFKNKYGMNILIKGDNYERNQFRRIEVKIFRVCEN